MQIKVKNAEEKDMDKIKKALNNSKNPIKGPILAFRVVGEDIGNFSKQLNEAGIKSSSLHLKNKEGEDIFYTVIEKNKEKDFIRTAKDLAIDVVNKDISVEDISERLTTFPVVSDKDLKNIAFTGQINGFNEIKTDARVAYMVKELAESEYLKGKNIPNVSFDFYPTGEGKIGEIKYLDTKENRKEINSLLVLATAKATDKDALKFAERRMDTDRQIRQFVNNPKKEGALVIMSASRFLGDKSQPYLRFDGKKMYIGDKDGNEKAISPSQKKEFTESLYKTLNKMDDITLIRGVRSKDVLEKENKEMFEKNKSSEKHAKMLKEKEAMIRRIMETVDPTKLDEGVLSGIISEIGANTDSKGRTHSSSIELYQDVKEGADKQQLDEHLNTPEAKIRERDGDNTLESGQSFIDPETIKMIQKTEITLENDVSDLVPEYDPAEQEVQEVPGRKQLETRTTTEITTFAK